jgi:hypothetical protein
MASPYAAAAGVARTPALCPVTQALLVLYSGGSTIKGGMAGN